MGCFKCAARKFAEAISGGNIGAIIFAILILLIFSAIVVGGLVMAITSL